jgi:hypothetical protein
MESIPYGGWQNCARILSGEVEAIVTMEVGPRIIRLGFVGGKNELHEDPDEMGLTGVTSYHSFGGHRLWIAPEDKVRTYQPENDPVLFREEGGWQIFSTQGDQFGMRKEIRVRSTGDGGFRLDHRIFNEGTTGIEMAPWALTVMAPGGTCYIPQPEFKPFPAILTPVRPLAMWSYLDMSDPRLRWGKRLIRLRQDKSMPAIKLGTAVDQGYAGYLNGESLFIKRFAHLQGESYPDFGCNFETFTRQDMLEFETLGPLRRLEPGQSVTHLEAWRLFPSVKLQEDEDPCADQLAQYAAKAPEVQSQKPTS